MDEVRGTNVLLENVVSQFQVFGEGLIDIRRIVDSHSDRFDRLETRMDRLEMRFDHLEATSSKEHHLMLQMIKELNEE